jgi:ABC-type polysaccharide/polyol phosphate transport system ATPase subunit
VSGLSPGLSRLALPAPRDGHLLVNIRKFSGVVHRSLAALIDRDMLDPTTARFLQACARSGLSGPVAGAPGAGKTTMLNVVAAAYETAGGRVICTATAGQTARRLGGEADIDNSRTIASVMWHLDQDRLQLDSRTEVILDEAS